MLEVQFKPVLDTIGSVESNLKVEAPILKLKLAFRDDPTLAHISQIESELTLVGVKQVSQRVVAKLCYELLRLVSFVFPLTLLPIE